MSEAHHADKVRSFIVERLLSTLLYTCVQSLDYIYRNPNSMECLTWSERLFSFSRDRWVLGSSRPTVVRPWSPVSPALYTRNCYMPPVFHPFSGTECLYYALSWFWKWKTRVVSDRCIDTRTGRKLQPPEIFLCVGYLVHGHSVHFDRFAVLL